MRGKERCRLHGGKSTGARTLAGIQRIRKGRWKHGGRSAKLQAEYQEWKCQQEELEAEYLSMQLNLERDPWFRRLLHGLPPPAPQVRVQLAKRGFCKTPPPEWEEGKPSQDLWESTNPLLEK
jgi:hypothetical protein